MSDIFGKTTYRHYEELRKRGFSPDEYVRDNWANVPATQGKTHNFQALQTRAVQGSEPLGYLSDNFVAIQAQVEEILRIEARFERFIPLKTDIPEGAQTFGVPVVDGVGEAGFIDNFGTDAQSVSVSQFLDTGQVSVGGNVAKYSDEELRAAMFTGLPLQTLTVDMATRRCMRHIERVAFNGHESRLGLLNQPTSGTDAVARSTAAKTFAASNGMEIAQAITDEIGAMVDDTNEVIGETITGEIVIGLPPIQYNRIKSLVVTDTGTDLSVAEHIMRHNGWTDEARGNSIRFERLSELKNAASTTPATRMLMVLRSDQIVQFPVAFMPRVKTAIRHEYGVNVPLEYKIGLEAYVKRPDGIRYLDGI